MELYRIGDKVVAREKLLSSLDDILRDRALGATQAEAARAAGVPRSFVSNLETLGELRHGARVALIAFPVSNGAELKQLTDRYSVDLTLVFSQEERNQVEGSSARDLFNRLLDTLCELKDFDAVVVAASDWRVETFRRVIDADVIGVVLGTSPIDTDIKVNLSEIEDILIGLTQRREAKQAKKRSGFSRLSREWSPSKK